ncbi:hypothetical protein ACIQC7_27810 [Kitasatospora sp. NPDC088556]|uniref:hypothetical protein n=1 Tax=Kitasatospora sp. NPDC088556 TaxID=3364076 RepID=UPI0037FC1C8B
MTSHYQQQLAQQLRAAEDELGKLRRRVAELIEQRDRAQAGTHERAALLENARDLLEPWGGHGDAWPNIAPAIEALIAERLKYGNGYNQERDRAEQAEARIVAVRAAHQRFEDRCGDCYNPDYPEPWPCPTIRALDGAEARP